MAMNIKNPEVERLAHELAALTGESLTTAVSTSLRERLARVSSNRTPGLAARLHAIGQDCARRIPESYKNLDHTAFLYDDMGLPK